jgi:arginyl-tRNA synthetase
VFDWDDVLNMQGNSGPYVQYAAARCASVLAKAADRHTGKAEGELNANERAVAVRLLQFPEAVEIAGKEYAPHYLCTYLYELAQDYNTFYNNHQILGSENESLRLALTQNVGRTLTQGLELLGIATPEKM